ncbi:S24/S26 family peptidase [Natrialba asiatica]|uniref:Peptidase S24/S26A/S26B n=1 Tax=Natrialba asiatica (strain ATCC 700177 / DSM 12278 / JCM 9576 / FERM P-10747 / NBRC 102637 / 172P1) TaxID=29540 RepID=M0AHI7_NATA1|nr:S26 family signal peptidase [Natrialba asiatica]ELY97994.1 peptidase S24/S26A/S26B [Natrialba asiatica DSM 12278]
MSDRRPEDPPATDSDTSSVSIEDDGLLRWLLRSEEGAVVVVRDVASTVTIVALIGLVLFAASGVWPPLVAVESGSMEPNIHTGDLVFVVDDDRFAGENAVDGTGVVTLEDGQNGGGKHFGRPGDVIVFAPDGDASETPVIHRARFWVEAGENWVETKADADALAGRTCADLSSCPAPHDGFVTKGDANDLYDQVDGRYAETTVVKSDWISSKAGFRIPRLGQVRLAFDSLLAVAPPQPLSGPISSAILPWP